MIRGGRSTSRGLMIVVIVALVLSAPTVAFAHHGPDSMFPTANYNPTCVDGNIGSTFCRTDNSTLTVWRQTMTVTARTRIRDALNQQFHPTDLNVVFVSSPSYSGSAETDIIYQVGSGVPTGLDGITWCNDAVSSTRCDQHYIRFRTSGVVTFGLACHETGHGVGLTHPAEASPSSPNNNNTYGCMVTPVAAGTGLGAHNVQQINGAYS